MAYFIICMNKKLKAPSTSIDPKIVKVKKSLARVSSSTANTKIGEISSPSLVCYIYSGDKNSRHLPDKKTV